MEEFKKKQDKATPITKISDDLQVGGDLDLSATPIPSLPDDLKVGGDIVVPGNISSGIPDGPLRDARTGREVLAKRPYPGFAWKTGHALRSVTNEEAARGLQRESVDIGGDPFEWVPVDELDIEEVR